MYKCADSHFKLPSVILQVGQICAKALLMFPALFIAAFFTKLKVVVGYCRKETGGQKGKTVVNVRVILWLVMTPLSPVCDLFVYAFGS